MGLRGRHGEEGCHRGRHSTRCTRGRWSGMIRDGMETVSWRRWWGSIGWNNNKRKKDVGGEGGDCEDQESKGTNPCGAFPSSIDFGWGEIWILGEDRIHVDLADVRCDVEKERKPADPVEKLNFANLPSLRRETLQRSEDLMEEGAESNVRRGGTFETGIAFTNEEA